MNLRAKPWHEIGAYPVAMTLGLLVAWFDVHIPFGDDTEKVTVLLWLVSSGVLGLLQPRQPWRWALLIGPWVAIVHGVRHALGIPDTMNPNTYATALILVPVSCVVCLIGAYCGALARRAISGN
jgi:hydrogenase/urease accessory protein HupE